jgi:hypothetical protein
MYATSGLAATASHSPDSHSVYTPLRSPACALTATQTEGDQSLQHCPGIGGYSLDVLDDDSRMSVTVVTSAGEQRPLDLWDTVTPQFSRLGPHAEWRVQSAAGRIDPTALILTLRARKDADSQSEIVLLVVAKILPSEICVVASVPRGSGATATARKIADAAAGMPCLAHTQQMQGGSGDTDGL